MGFVHIRGNQAAILDINEQHWRDVLDVNVVGMFMCAKHAARYMVSVCVFATLLQSVGVKR